MRFTVSPRIRCLLVTIAASFLFCTGRSDAAPFSGQPLPDFSVVSTAGQSISQDNYRGHVLIVDFFATWCQPCRTSIPHLVELQRKYGRQGLEILGLSVDEGGERVLPPFAGELRVRYPLALAGDATVAAFGVRSVPALYLVNRKGVVVDVYHGYTTESARSLEQTIKRLLAER